jgi:hypothetical protein
VLEQEAAQARRDGRADEAAELADRTRVLETVAGKLRRLFPAGALRGTGAEAAFDVDARRRALADATPEGQEVVQLDPSRTAAEAQGLRRRSVWLQAWSIPLILALAALTFARLSDLVRPWLVMSAVVLFVAVGVAAVLTVSL